jgi:spermidine/putrescine transport system ATP-binding protein
MESEKFKKRNISRKFKEEEIAYRVDNMIELVGLTGNEHKMPTELSGGMQQRVALARALVVEPDILLLDEPLSALDAKVRKQMQLELKRLHQELGLTFILVTHDQEEALALSNKVVVMSKGRVEQIDSPKRVYDTPKNEWVASFIGKTNMFDGSYIGKNKITFAGETFKINIDAVKKITTRANVKFMIRPEDIIITSPEKGFIKARVAQVLYKGQMYEIRCL